VVYGMGELTAVLDKISQLVRHLIIETKNLEFSKTIFLQLIQGIGRELDRIALLCPGPEGERFCTSTRNFVSSTSEYVKAIHTNVGTQLMLQRFLHKGELYKDALKEVRAIADNQEESGNQQEDSTHLSLQATSLPLDYKPIDYGFVDQREVDFTVESRFIKSRENLIRVAKENHQKQLKEDSDPSDSVTVTDQVFDYLNEMLEHNVLSDATLQLTEEELAMEEVDLDML